MSGLVGEQPQDDPAGGLGLDDGRREPAMTLAGWRRFVDAPAASFELLPEKVWLALSGRDKEAYDEARLNYHSEMIIVATSALREVARQGRLLTLLNRREISARRGLIVSGQQTTGKTTALKQLGRTHELMVRQRYPGRLAGRIPVVYVTTPPKGSPRKLAMEFARFLGLPPVRRGYNTTDIADAVCQIMLGAQVDLVLVDELHNLNLATAVATLEGALRLHRHQPGSLTRQARYLHHRTGGMIGSLSHLVRAAARLAILEGDEAITRKLMDTIPVDYAAESCQHGAA